MSMENRRPQLNLAELHQLKWLLGGMLAVISAWTVLYMEVDAWFLLALVTFAAPVFIVKPALVAHVPRRMHRLAFPALVAIFAMDVAAHLKEPLPAVIRLALMLLLYRVVTPRKRRDDLQLIVMGLFLIVVGGVLSVSIVFAAQIVVFTACALIFLLVITLVDTMEQGLPAATGEDVSGWMHASWRRLAGRLRECLDWRVVALSCLLFSGVVGLSAVLFTAIPRFDLGSSLFLDGMISRKAKTGFSENIQFGDVVDIQQDTSVALSVDVSDRSKVPSDLYWRMLVLDEYTRGSFGMSEVLRRSMDTPPERAAQARVEGNAKPRANAPVWKFYLEPGTSRFLPLLGGFSRITFEGAQDAVFSREMGLVMLRQTPVKMLAYKVEGMQPGAVSRLPLEGAEVPESDPKRAVFTGVGELKAKEAAQLAAWVKEIGAPPGNPEEFARRASAWLGRRHAYSLQSRIEPGEADPLVFWIGTKEPGHCELFAGAFTLLARTAGYPTRVVLGFHGGAWNARSENLMVRNSDAHAWCEIFDRKAEEWMRVDPTQGSAVVVGQTNEPQGETVIARIRDDSWDARLESLRIFWYRRIVNFDQNSQAGLLREAKKAINERVRAFKKELRHRLEALRAWLESPWDVRRIAAWAAAGLAAGGLFAGWRFYGRGSWRRWFGGKARGNTESVRREAGRWLRAIADSGFKEPDCADVRTQLEKLRYGPASRWPEPRGVFRRAKRVLAAKRKGRSF